MLMHVLVIAAALAAQETPFEIAPVSPDIRQSIPCEFRLPDIGRGDNPYDPDVIRVDAVFISPSGGKYPVPGFWYQGYTRAIEKDHEQLQMQEKAEWRLRFRPLEAGQYKVGVTVTRPGLPDASGEAQFDVVPADMPEAPAWRIETTQKRVFVSLDHKVTPLIGFNTCWPGAKGTYDYDRWFESMAKVGANWGRIWMWPMSMGIEARETERLNYNQYEAWRLDCVMGAAADKGIAIMLCLDYHGMFQDKPDMWGGNDFWPKHPYNAAHGGPCATQEDFFTLSEAKKLYQKRLRYMVARYASFRSLFCWEFFNEINIPYNRINPESSVRWHDEMAQWLRQADPYGHLITTSLAGGGDQPDLWRLASLDFSQMHVYLPTLIRPKDDTGFIHIANWTHHHLNDYGKPMIVGEYGIDGSGFHPEKDPHFRGLRQGVWAGIMSGGAGVSMSWWWDKIEENNLYPIWGSVAGFLKESGVTAGAWNPTRTPQCDNLEIRGIRALDVAAFYVVDPEFSYAHNAREEARTVSGKTLTFEELAAGRLGIRCWNPEKGGWMGEAVEAEVKDGKAAVALPDFAVDLAVAVRYR